MVTACVYTIFKSAFKRYSTLQTSPEEQEDVSSATLIYCAISNRSVDRRNYKLKESERKMLEERKIKTYEVFFRLRSNSHHRYFTLIRI